MAVDSTGSVYDELQIYRKPIMALSGGTQSMRTAKYAYLPPDPHEREDSTIFDARLKRTFLFNAFVDTCIHE